MTSSNALPWWPVPKACRKSTVALASHSVCQFDAFLGGVSDVSQVTADDLRRFIVDCRQRTKWQGTDQARAEPVSPTTVNTYVKKIIAFWARLERERIMERNTLASVRPPRVGKKLPRFFDDDAIRKVLRWQTSRGNWP